MVNLHETTGNRTDSALSFIVGQSLSFICWLVGSDQVILLM